MRRGSTALVASFAAIFEVMRPSPDAAVRGHDAENLGHGALPVRKSVLLAIFAASLLFAVAYFAEEAYACSCAAISPEEQAQGADAIFSGTVTDVDSAPFAPFRSPGSGPPLLGPVTFEVEESWKGVPVGEEVVVHGYEHDGNCGIPFREGSKEYLVYADRSEEGEATFRTSICEGTKTLSSAAPDLEILGPPETAPESNKEKENTERLASRGTGGTWLVVLGAGALLVGGGLLARRRLR